MLKVYKPAGSLKTVRTGNKTTEVVFDGTISHPAMTDAISALGREAGRHVHYAKTAYDKKYRTFWYGLAKRALRSAICLSCGKPDISLLGAAYRNSVEHST